MAPRSRVYFFKPLITILMLLIAFAAADPVTNVYQRPVVAGLGFSLAGDGFLMLPGDRSIPGLVSFLLAHLCYIGAFAARSGLRSSLVAPLPIALLGLAMFTVLSRHLGRMKLPVQAYLTVILVMAWRALKQWVGTRATGALLALSGATLFPVSDSALALDRFRGRFRSAQAVVLSRYCVAHGRSRSWSREDRN